MTLYYNGKITVNSQSYVHNSKMIRIISSIQKV